MSVRPRENKEGRTVFDVRVQYSGIRVSRTVPTTLTDAKRVESKILQELIKGRYEILKNRDNPKFRRYAEEYKKSVTWHKSYHNRTLLSINHLVKFFGNKRLTEITVQDLIDYRSMRLQTVKHATINREHTCLLTMLNVAVNNDQYLIYKNPLKGIKKFKEPPTENRMLSVDEYQKLLESAPEYFRRILFFACQTGMRLNEILDLKFGQIRAWFKGVEIELIETKSGNREYVPLGNEVIDLLQIIAKERNIALDNIADDNRGDYVFTGRRGQRIKSVRKPMARTFREAGIEQRPFHTFRHFWTTMMFQAGVDPLKIKKMGRWRDFETMMKYCFTTRPEEHVAANQLSEYLSRKTAKILDLRQYGGKIENKSDM